MPFQAIDVCGEYEKDAKLKRADVKILQEWLGKQPHLPVATELQLVFFLKSCYYSVEMTKNTIDNFFTVRSLCPDIFGATTEQIIRQTLSVGFIKILPGRTPEGHIVLFTKLIDHDSSNYVYLNQIKLLDMVVMLHLYQNGAPEGIRMILDLKGTTFGHMARINLVAAKKHFYHVQEGAPVRIKGMHLINMVPFTDKLIAMVKPFMKKDLYDLIHFHNDIEELYKVVPQVLLPKDYGGEAPTIAELRDANVDNLIENMELFPWQDSQKVDETRRPGKPKNESSLFGVDGTFKKLDLD